jgi:hypothetical protein
MRNVKTAINRRTGITAERTILTLGLSASEPTTPLPRRAHSTD